MIKKIYTALLLLVTSFASFAEVETYSIDIDYNGLSAVYPRLDLNTIDGIDLRIEKKPAAVMSDGETVVQRVEFKLTNATNLVATNLVDGVEHEGKYRAILTGPWVFKKLLVEISAANFNDGEAVQYRVKAIEKFSATNALVESEGADLIFGGGSLIDTTVDTVVDVVSTEIDGRRVVLKLLSHIKNNQVRIEATWLGRGTREITFNVSHDAKPRALNLIPLEDSIALNLDVTSEIIASMSLKLVLQNAFDLR